MALKPKIGEAFTRSAAGKTGGETSARTKKVRTTVDLEPPLWSKMQGWLGRQQEATGKRVQLAPVIRELLREISGEALAEDATDADRAAVEALAARIVARAAATL